MGGLLDLGLSETVELGESLVDAGQRAVKEKLGGAVVAAPLRECCNHSFRWVGDMQRMRMCEHTQNTVYVTVGGSLNEFGTRDVEVEELFYRSWEEYEHRADDETFDFAPWAHSILLNCRGGCVSTDANSIGAEL